jgi:hypothetical protein
MTEDDSGWRTEDVYQGNLNYGRPCFSVGPHGEMAAACFDTTLSCWLCERTDTGWVTTPFPFPYAGDVSAVYDTSGRLHCGYIVGEGPSDFWAAARADTGWSAVQVYRGWPGGVFVTFDASLEYSRDNRAWYLASYFWSYNSEIDGSQMALLRCSDTDWDTVWQNEYDGFQAAVALAADQDSAGFCRYPGPAGHYLHYYDELVEHNWSLTPGGMAYDTAFVPHLAYLPGSSEGPVRYAFRTNRWHADSVPGTTEANSVDIVLDTLGQPVIVFGTLDSGVWLARGVGVVAITEKPTPWHASAGIGRTVPTFCQSTFVLPGKKDAALLDLSGQKVMSMQPGVNDIRHVAPGVYFVVTPSPLPSGAAPGFATPPEGERLKEGGVRSAVSGGRSAVRKVIIQR